MFQEVFPHQHPGDARRHVVWVLIGSQIFRCSVHSVRPVTATERFQFETSGSEDMLSWRSLADVLPKREFVDVVPEEPDEHELELPQLPPQPDDSTVVFPRRRLITKTTFKASDYIGNPVRDRLQRVDDYQEDEHQPGASTAAGSSGRPATPTPTTTTRAISRPSDEVANEHELPEAKRLKSDPSHNASIGYNWVAQLEPEAAEESKGMDLYTAMDETLECLRVEFDVPAPTSNRQRKAMDRNPVAYLVKKMRDSEVSISKLPMEERPLFGRAKAKEVDSFLKNEALQRCLDDAEVARAYSTNRIVRARWVLTWKLVPPEDQREACQDALENPETLHDRAGLRKAKARIVLLGFEHPSLLDPSFKASGPVPSTLGRNLLYLMAAHHEWDLEGLDLATAFLQTNPTEADAELWTSGVEELRQALNVGSEGIMRILKNIYGSTTAPRGLWLALHKKLTSLGAVPVLGERCLWIWRSQTQLHRGRPRTIGTFIVLVMINRQSGKRSRRRLTLPTVGYCQTAELPTYWD